MTTTDLKALYSGLYQQINEHGMKRMKKTMERPNVTPEFSVVILD